MNNEVLIQLDHVKKYFEFYDGFTKKYVRAVDDITLDIFQGETLGLVGESGCGKSTLGRTILRLHGITDGTVTMRGKDLYELTPRELCAARRDMQIIFQDPLACLNPRKTIWQIIEEPLLFHGVQDKREREKRIVKIMEDVGLDPSAGSRYPHEFSGGQQQRVGIARALILRPKFIVCDEPVSALDVSVQAQVLNLLQDLKDQYGLTYLFISHNLSVVKHICDRVAVMYLGRVVELAPKDELFKHPRHPYSKALIAAIPVPDPTQSRNQIILEGDIPNPVNPPPGCSFHPRCSLRGPKCDCVKPELVEIMPQTFVSCHRYQSADAAPH